MRATITIALVCLLAAGCAGGGDQQSSTDTTLAYSAPADTRYSYAPPRTRSYVHVGPMGEIRIGGDVAPRERVRQIAKVGGISYYLGTSRDGAGADRLEDYALSILGTGGTITPHRLAPVAVLDDALTLPANAHLAQAVVDGILILNDALPPEFQLQPVLASDLLVRPPNPLLLVDIQTRAQIQVSCSPTAIACARRIGAGYHLHIPDDFETTQPEFARTVVVHELLHAMGLWGHVESVPFPDSILGKHGHFFPNPGYIISRIDREALQALYMNFVPSHYNSLGQWSDTTFHLMGETRDGTTTFGVALFNGLPQPWAVGTAPRTSLEDNALLGGTATWRGNLLGFSGPSPLAGKAELEVALSTLANAESTHPLRFRDIAYLNRFESSGSELWFSSRNLDYRVAIGGNVFENTDGDGIVTGAFMGARHQHMAGTLKRQDMVGAFGGSR